MILTKNTDELRQLVQQHVAADQVIQGLYWDTENSRGCFIGCLNHSDRPDAAEQRFGLPIMVQRIAESIFEALPPDEAQAFFAALPDAVARDGKDLTLVGWQFLAAELRALPPQSDEIQAVIDPVIVGMDQLAAAEAWPEAAAAWDAARAAADRAAKLSAFAAAMAALRAAESAATWAAGSAATWGATWATTSAADGAADSAAARRRQRDCLLELIAAAPVVSTIEDHQTP